MTHASSFTSAVAAAALLAGIVLPERPAQACDSNPMLGAVCFFAFNFCPSGYVPLDGSTVPSTASYYDGFSNLFGTTYDPRKQRVVLPDLMASSPVARSSPASTNNGQPTPPNSLTLGQVRGASSVTLTPQNIPGHTHVPTYDTTVPLNASVAVANTSGNQKDVMNGVIAIWTEKGSDLFATPSTQGKPVSMKAGTIPTTLNAEGTMTTPTQVGPHGVPVAIQPPSLGLTICIATSGMYPPGIPAGSQQQ